MQGDSRLMDMTAEDDFLGFYDEKVHIKMCLILGSYRVMAT
jgi:hypothetical protein